MASLEQCTVGGSTYNLSVPFIAGTGSTAGTWLGQLDGLTEYYDGLLILYKPSVAGASTTTLNLNSLGAKTCYINNTTKLTTHFPANQPILLAYSSSQNSGCFMCIDDYWTNSDTNPTGTVNYSTEEQDTGLTWIDGKHVYQRTFMFNSIISARVSTWTKTTIQASPLNIYNTINAVGHSDTGWSYPITVAADQTYLMFMHFRNATLGFKGFTIQYIKK